jgi:poly(hydroxyalkanoate) depolymerase family esterase
MAGLGTTVARLLRQQTGWRHTLTDALDYNAIPAIRGSGVLEEVADHGANPGNLRMLRYKPSKVQENSPLVVVLHGCTQHAADYANGAGWIELADRFGFCLLLPEQRRSNNPNLCFNWFVPADTTRGSGEVQSIRLMIKRTADDWSIDRKRIFVTGLSAGGAMASAMLATYPELFAGGAIIAGLPYQSASDIPGAFQVMAEGRSLPAEDWADYIRSASPYQGPWPRVSIWQGTADPTVNPRNADEIVKQWTALHKMADKPDREENRTGYVRRVWNDESGKPAIEEYTVTGLGHGTPLATGSGKDHFGAAAPFLLEVGLSSSHRIAEFWGLAEEHQVRRTAPAEVAFASNEPLPATSSVAAMERDGVELTQRIERPAPRQGIASPRHDVGAIINRALRSAGLIK